MVMSALIMPSHRMRCSHPMPVATSSSSRRHTILKTEMKNLLQFYNSVSDTVGCVLSDEMKYIVIIFEVYIRTAGKFLLRVHHVLYNVHQYVMFIWCFRNRVKQSNFAAHATALCLLCYLPLMGMLSSDGVESHLWTPPATWM